MSFCVWLIWTRRKAQSSQSDTNNTFPVTSSRPHPNPSQSVALPIVTNERSFRRTLRLLSACRERNGRRRSAVDIWSAHRFPYLRSVGPGRATELVDGPRNEDDGQNRQHKHRKKRRIPRRLCHVALQKMPSLSHASYIRYGITYTPRSMRLQVSNRRRLRFLLLFSFPLLDIEVINTSNTHL